MTKDWEGFESPHEHKVPAEALEQPTGNSSMLPVAWQWLTSGQMRKKIPKIETPEHWRPLYTHPKEWQGLSDDEIWDIANFLGKNKEWDYPVMFAKTIEKALKEKNHE